MFIVDSQVHIWGADTPARPWPTGRGVGAQKPYPVTRDMLLFEMELAKVSRIADGSADWLWPAAEKAMPSFSAQEYPFRDVHDAIHRLVDAFGPRRTFWGTDLTRMPCSYRECIDLFTKEQQSWLKGDDLEFVMGRAVCDWLGWRR